MSTTLSIMSTMMYNTSHSIRHALAVARSADGPGALGFVRIVDREWEGATP